MVKKKATKRELIEKINELDDKLKRALADYQNLSRRIEERRRDLESQAGARIIDKLLDVYQDLKRAEKHIKDRGLSMAVKQFWAVLESEFVEEIKSDGQDFDPELMDCVEVVEGEENKVMETVSKGYLLNGQVIRPAKVKVGKGGQKK